MKLHPAIYKKGFYHDRIPITIVNGTATIRTKIENRTTVFNKRNNLVISKNIAPDGEAADANAGHNH